MMSPPIPSSRRSRWLPLVVAVLTACAIARFAAAAYSGLGISEGDYYQTFPGPYVRTLNPTLWNSPDLASSRSFHQNVYLYGPAQYLTLYPVAFLDSYREVALWLLVVYGLLSVATIGILWRTMTVGERRLPYGLPIAFSVAWLFSPLVQCYVQREFEVAVFFFVSLGAYLLVTRRELAGGVPFGYITWFKLLPIAFLPYFAVRRSLKAVCGFLIGSAIVLGLGQLAFGLDRFLVFNSRTVSPDGDVAHVIGAQLQPLAGRRPTFVFDPRISPGHIGTGFCSKWDELNETMASVKWALCGLNLRHSWLPSRELFYAIAGAILLLSAWGFLRRSAAHATALEKKWQTIWELSLVLMASTVLVRAHYYYLIVLVFPLTALLFRYALYTAHRVKMTILLFSYVVLSGFIIPTSALSALAHQNVWRAYMLHDVYLYGELTLFGLVLWEYCRKAGQSRGPATVS